MSRTDVCRSRAGRKRRAASLSALAIVAAFGEFAGLPIAAASVVEIHYAPVENLERIDVDLIRSARAKIDMAVYSLTDWPVVDALIDAHRRGVVIRIVLDPNQQQAFDRLREIEGFIRTAPPGPYMHLKSYAIDGRTLRTGSANLSASGLKQQDNDVVIVRDATMVDSFEARFEKIWEASKPVPKSGNLLAGRETTKVKAATTSAPACAIKGNVSGKGERIYHLPGSRHYARVAMNGPGERWFCSEPEAKAAGWRPAASR
jgi:phosphatidylserine/phosphatidylglycerophosphate/cardiolipin synthase-like enzyme